MEAEADRKGLPVDPKQLRQLTVADLITRYRDTVSVRKRGKEFETIRLNMMLRHSLAEVSLSNLTSALFTAYREERLRVCKPETVRRELSILQHVFEVARKEWSVPLLSNPVADVRKPPAGKARDRRLNDDEASLFEACQKCRNRTIEPVVRLAIETGMRRGELLSLTWNDVDLANRTLHIENTKNGHPRTIPLTGAAVRIIESIPKSDDDRLFPLSRNALRLAWERTVKRAGVEDLHFHDLRHEAISRFFERGLSVPEVALISGHRDPRMLFRYTHLRAEDIAQKLR
jgi:integrase